MRTGLKGDESKEKSIKDSQTSNITASIAKAVISAANGARTRRRTVAGAARN
jgi:hypothetical protein